MLEIIDLNVRYGRREILRGVRLKIDSEKIVVLGPNGSGKTTLIKSILSLILYSGKVFINGVEVRG
jgi:Cu-processing system ATP-binding protein